MSSSKWEAEKMTLEFTRMDGCGDDDLKALAKRLGFIVDFEVSRDLSTIASMIEKYSWVMEVTDPSFEDFCQYMKDLKDLEEFKASISEFVLFRQFVDELTLGTISINGFNFSKFYDFGDRLQRKLNLGEWSK